MADNDQRRLFLAQNVFEAGKTCGSTFSRHTGIHNTSAGHSFQISRITLMRTDSGPVSYTVAKREDNGIIGKPGQLNVRCAGHQTDHD